MQIAEKIQQCIQNLPSFLQDEALDFVKYLNFKKEVHHDQHQ